MIEGSFRLRDVYGPFMMSKAIVEIPLPPLIISRVFLTTLMLLQALVLAILVVS